MAESKTAATSEPALQPTNDELQAAWTEAIHAESIGGARAETRAKLQALRDRRSTWFGSENSLRMALDGYLRGEPNE